MNRWYVAVTEPREELSCVAAMKFVGIEAFSPMERFARKDQWKRWHLVARPRMPGYVFCSLGEDEEIGLALDLRHVGCLLPSRGRKPRPVSRPLMHARVEALRAAEELNAGVTLDDLLPKRERKRRAPPAFWQEYLGAGSDENASVLGEKLRAAVMGLLEPEISLEDAA